jgi:hypothetical protein
MDSGRVYLWKSLSAELRESNFPLPPFSELPEITVAHDPVSLQFGLKAIAQGSLVSLCLSMSHDKESSLDRNSIFAVLQFLREATCRRRGLARDRREINFDNVAR